MLASISSKQCVNVDCINNAITKQTNAKVLSYQADNVAERNGIRNVDAFFLYKIVMHLATLDSNAMDRHLRVTFYDLTSNSVCKNDNINKFIPTLIKAILNSMHMVKQPMTYISSCPMLTLLFLMINSTSMKCLYDVWIGMGEMKNIKFESHAMRKNKTCLTHLPLCMGLKTHDACRIPLLLMVTLDNVCFV